MPLRLCKIALTSVSFLFLLTVVFNNLTDYNSNYQFVRHVLSMDTTFPGNSGLWRALPSKPIWVVSYALIILWEAMTGLLIGWGTLRLWKARHASLAEWRKAKAPALVGFTASLLQWYFGFVTVGGEWFLMWQSKTWNGQDAAFRMFTIMGISLLFLLLGDD